MICLLLVVADGMQKAICLVLNTVLNINAWESQEHPRVSEQPRTQRMGARVELSYITSVLSDPSVLPKPPLVTALGTHSYAPAL